MDDKSRKFMGDCRRGVDLDGAPLPRRRRHGDPGGLYILQSLSESDGFWRILSGTEVLFDFGNREKGAKQGMLALRHYGFNYRCIVGSTGSSFRYLRR